MLARPQDLQIGRLADQTDRRPQVRLPAIGLVRLPELENTIVTSQQVGTTKLQNS